MKISKQERLIIIIFVVVAILGVGIFMFVWPQYNAIGTNQKKLKTVESQRDTIMQTLEREGTISSEIEAAYQEGKDLADAFYPDLTTYEADEIVRKFIKNVGDASNGLTITGMKVDPMVTETLSVSQFIPTEVTYPLKDFAATTVTVTDSEEQAAELTGQEKIDQFKKLMVSYLSITEPVKVGCVKVSFTASAKNVDLLNKFVDSINAGVYDESIKGADGKPQKKATFLTGAAFIMSQDSQSSQAATTSDGATSEDAGTAAAVKKDPTMDFTINLYCIEPVSAPFSTESNQ